MNLSSATIWVTTRCNMLCEHCNQGKLSTDYKGVTFDFARYKTRLIDGFHELGTRDIVLTGGEPTVELDHTCMMASTFFDAGIVPLLQTNCLDFPYDVRQRLLDAGVFTIHTSLDGMQSTHDQIRGVEGSFQKTTANIAAAVEHGFQVVVRMTLMQKNIGELEQVANVVRETGATILKIRPVVPAGRASDTLCPTADEVAKAISLAKELSKKQTISFGTSCFEYVQGVHTKDARGCFHRGMNIGPNADLYPCGYHRLFLGNLENITLPEAWLGPRMSALRNFEQSEFCGSCQYATSCHGSCRANTLSLGLKTGEPDRYCPLATSHTGESFDVGNDGSLQIINHDGLRLELMSMPTGHKLIIDPLLEDHSSPGNERIGPFTLTQLTHRSIKQNGHAKTFVVEHDGLRLLYIGAFDDKLMKSLPTKTPIDVIAGILPDSWSSDDQKLVDQVLQKLQPRVFLPGVKYTNGEIEEKMESLHYSEVRRFSTKQVNLDINNLPLQKESWILD